MILVRQIFKKKSAKKFSMKACLISNTTKSRGCDLLKLSKIKSEQVRAKLDVN